MAAAMINAAVAKALYEVQLETLANFKKYLADKEDVDMEFMEELIDGFKAKIESEKPKEGKGAKGKAKADSDGEVPEKKKRAASAYSMYIKHKMHLLKAEGVKAGKELMSKAVEAWGELDNDTKEAFKRTLKEHPDYTAEELYATVVEATVELPKPEAKLEAAEPEAEAEAEAEAEPTPAPVKPAPKNKKSKKTT